MANDDYFKILYIILTELYEAKKQGKKINLDDISPQRFKITERRLRSLRTGHQYFNMERTRVTFGPRVFYW